MIQMENEVSGISHEFDFDVQKLIKTLKNIKISFKRTFEIVRSLYINLSQQQIKRERRID